MCEPERPIPLADVRPERSLAPVLADSESDLSHESPDKKFNEQLSLCNLLIINKLKCYGHYKTTSNAIFSTI